MYRYIIILLCLIGVITCRTFIVEPPLDFEEVTTSVEQPRWVPVGLCADTTSPMIARPSNVLLDSTYLGYIWNSQTQIKSDTFYEDGFITSVPEAFENRLLNDGFTVFPGSICDETVEMGDSLYTSYQFGMDSVPFGYYAIYKTSYHIPKGTLLQGYEN